MPTISAIDYNIIKDYKGEKSNRRYYGEELQAVSDQTAYRVEKVLKKRKKIINWNILLNG